MIELKKMILLEIFGYNYTYILYTVMFLQVVLII